MFEFRDSLVPVGAGLGVFLVVVGLATVAGQPWQTATTGVAVGKSLGGLLAATLGAGLAWLAVRE